MAFAYIGVELKFQGKGVYETAHVASSTNKKYQLEIGKQVLAVEKKYFRPTEVDLLIGDSTKAKEKLGWTAETALEDIG